ncbi:phosphate binding protein [Clostridium thermobutyricum]|uniref:Phosphate-binding protein n=1 Tax=Clostridium thermobutyricum TaxID=29372 RepID=N9Y1N7_9CLOT|nr:phosphate ABC transporter substrate-binding protein [Clostridium thermobutyricum]ENZ01717.1 phosphate binding protein [Clostridium thermobutyricum]
MRKRNLKLICLAGILCISGGIFAGCGATEEESTGEDIKGTITISGSSAMLPLMESSIEKYKEVNKDAVINAQAGGSGTGLSQVLEGAVDIGNSDVFAKDKLGEEKEKELVDHKVIAQGFGVVVNKEAGVTNLTKDQIKKIFKGEIKNWKEVGGNDEEILLIHRPESSGTRATFTEKILDGDKDLENDSLGATQDSNGAVLNTMKKHKGGISYVALTYMRTDEAKGALNLVSIDGVEATSENIEEGKYDFWSWGHMYTKGEAKGLTKDFIDFVGSDKNSEVIEELGLIKGSEIKE